MTAVSSSRADNAHRHLLNFVKSLARADALRDAVAEELWCDSASPEKFKNEQGKRMK